MNYLDYTAKTQAISFPSVSASPSNPYTLYNAPNDIIYVNTGSGWAAGVQPSSNSVYAAVSSLPAATKAAVVTSVATVAPMTPAHAAVATKAASVIVQGH
jgi:hypothetical protein